MLNMISRNDLDLEQKMNLIRDKERGLSHPELRRNFECPLVLCQIFLNEKLNILTIMKLIETKN
jgi:hypothetical protein